MLPIPPLLNELVAARRWPANADQEVAQNLTALVPPERVRRLGVEEDTIYLLAPPLHTIRQRCKAGEKFWSWPQAAPSEIDFDLALDIGDFGLGSDAPILLDYRVNMANPRVICLCRSNGGLDNHWRVVAPDFPAFVDVLGL